MSNLIVIGIIIEILIALGVIFLIKKFMKIQTKQPALSKKKIKNLKF